MKLSLRSLFVSVLILLLGTSGPLMAQTSANAKAEGERLERQWWEDAKKGDMEAMEKTISIGFQSLHFDGFRNKEAEVKMIKSLKMGGYKLSNFNVTKVNNNYIVAYTAAVDETIDGKTLSGQPTNRLTVWEKSNTGWKVIAHSNSSVPKK